MSDPVSVRPRMSKSDENEKNEDKETEENDDEKDKNEEKEIVHQFEEEDTGRRPQYMTEEIKVDLIDESKEEDKVKVVGSDPNRQLEVDRFLLDFIAKSKEEIKYMTEKNRSIDDAFDKTYQ